MSDTHVRWMRIALLEAQKAFKIDEIPVGAIVVLDNKIIGKITSEKNLQVNDSNGKEINFDDFGWDSFKT